MIKEAYCSFEVCKLLREKGFDEPCRSYFTDGTDYCYCTYDCDERTDINLGVFEYLRPTHQMVMAWLREKYKIMITIIPQEVSVGVDRMCYCIYRITEDLYQLLCNGKIDNLVDSYEETVEAALKYCLERLI